jgi:hypothetical protein
MLKDLTVQQHCCEKFLQVGSWGVGQGGPALSRVFQL